MWATDHVLVHKTDAQYGHIYGILSTLAYVAGRFPTLKLGASVINVPLRNAVVLAKELASLDTLSRGRLIVGVGLGDADDIPEYDSLGVGHVYHQRGAFLDEAIRLWRHLWSGSAEPFEGRFYRLRDYAFGPLPAQGARLPIVVGGRSPAAFRRAVTLGDGYHATRCSPAELAAALPQLQTAAEQAGRPVPPVSVRVRVRLAGPSAMQAEVRAFQELGVQHLALLFEETSPEGVAAAAERFHQEVLAAL